MKNTKSLLSFCMGFSFFVVFMEIFFSTAGISIPSIRVNSQKGERYIPNRTINSLFSTEGFGLANTNKYGWFGKAYDKKNEESIKIAVVGNSYVAARQVFERNNFISIAEKKMNESKAIPSTALYNFGKEALPIQELLFVVEEVKVENNPDYMVVVLTDRSFGRINRMIPYYEFKEKDLILNTEFKNSSNFRLYNKMKSFGLEESALIYLLYRVKNRLNLAPNIILDKFHTTENYLESEFANKSLTLTQTDEIILKTIDEKENIIFVLNVDLDKDHLLESLLKFSPIISLEKELRLMKDEGENLNFWPIDNQIGHWNNKAHRIVGEILANEFEGIIQNRND